MVDEAAVEEVLGRLITDLGATGGAQLADIGLRTGLWAAMAGAGPLTPADVADRAGVHELLAHEWLKGQAAGGYVTYDSLTGTFDLDAATAAVFAEEPYVSMVRGFLDMLAAMSRDLPAVADGYRSGQGFGWHERSPEHWGGTDLMTKAAIAQPLTDVWIPAIDGLAARLETGARVADIGCGYGATSIALAGAHPASRFWGFDYHDASIARARKAAAGKGVGDRTTFEVATATDFPGQGYDLVLYVDALHDFGDPVAALAHARTTLAPDGVTVLVEPNGADRVEDNFTPLGRLWYAASAQVCTPNAVSQEGRALGTLAGESALRRTAGAAGYAHVRRVDAQSPLNLVLELRP